MRYILLVSPVTSSTRRDELSGFLFSPAGSSYRLRQLFLNYEEAGDSFEEPVARYATKAIG